MEAPTNGCAERSCGSHGGYRSCFHRFCNTRFLNRMPPNYETETLILPKDYSVGRITVYRPNETEPSELLEAQGTVCVPKSSKLFLDLSQDVCDDLRRVHSIPNSLLANGINISERTLARA